MVNLHTFVIKNRKILIFSIIILASYLYLLHSSLGQLGYIFSTFVMITFFIMLFFGYCIFAYGENLIFINKQLKVNHDKLKELDVSLFEAIYKDSLRYLGSESEAVRLGAIYNLHNLVMRSENKISSKQILDIFCSHVRALTNDNKYKILNKLTPSIEIQSTLNLIFSKEIIKDNVYESSLINLAGSYLVGAELKDANLKNAILVNTNFNLSNLENADLYGALLERSSFDGCDFKKANLEKVNAYKTSFISANFEKANIKDAVFIEANLQTANLRKANFIGTNLLNSQMQFTSLKEAKFKIEDSKQNNIYANWIFVENEQEIVDKLQNKLFSLAKNNMFNSYDERITRIADAILSLKKLQYRKKKIKEDLKEIIHYLEQEKSAIVIEQSN